MPPDPPAPGEAPREASLADRAVFAAQFVARPAGHGVGVAEQHRARPRDGRRGPARAPARRRSWSSSARAAGRSPACSPTAWRDGAASSRWRSTRCSRTASPSASPTSRSCPPTSRSCRPCSRCGASPGPTWWSAASAGRRRVRAARTRWCPASPRALADDGVLVQFAYCATSLGRAGTCPARRARRVLRAGGDLVRGVAQPAPGRRPPGVPSAAMRIPAVIGERPEGRQRVTAPLAQGSRRPAPRDPPRSGTGRP